MAGTSFTVSGGKTNTYRVTIDVCKIRDNVYATEGGKLSDGAVRNWLRSAGFEHEVDGGDTWIVAEENLRLLDTSEIVRVEKIHRESFAASRT